MSACRFTETVSALPLTSTLTIPRRREGKFGVGVRLGWPDFGHIVLCVRKGARQCAATLGYHPD